MSSLAETTRPRAETRGPGQDAAPASGARAALRGAPRPDLIRDETLGEIFGASARARPDHPALVDGSRTGPDGTHPVLTYAQVEAQAAEIARGLAHRGIGPGDVVGLWMARGPDLLVAQIGITL